MRRIVNIILLCIVILIGLLFYSKIYYPTLPIDSISKREVLNKVKTSGERMVKLTEENGYEWYITKMSQGEATEYLKQMMEEQGWIFKEQMGGGLIFQKDNEDLIIVGEMWTGKYVIFQIPISK